MASPWQAVKQSGHTSKAVSFFNIGKASPLRPYIWIEFYSRGNTSKRQLNAHVLSFISCVKSKTQHFRHLYRAKNFQKNDSAGQRIFKTVYVVLIAHTSECITLSRRIAYLMFVKSIHGFMPVLAFVTLTLPLSGCLQPPARSMNEGLNLQSAYVAELENTQSAEDETDNHQDIYNTVQWWTLYDDPDLNGLITHAFSNSPSLGQIRARLKQASALKDKFSSALWPSLNVSAKRSTYNGSTDVPSDFDLTGAASYEVDLWGKNRATSDSYALKEQASRENIHGAAITLSANIVDLWLKILALVEQENLLREQIETNQTIYELMQNRFEMGSAKALDVLQQEGIVSASKAELPDILSAQAQAVNALSLLIGEAPSNAVTVHAKPLPEPLPMAGAGIPSALMQNRPDIMAAWLQLLSNDKNVGIAKANRLPSFDLSAVYTAGNTKFSDVFDSWLIVLAGQLAAPILDGGALAAEQRYQEALADESFHAYRETVLRAVGDVEDALVTNRFQDEKILALNDQLRAARETLEQAQISYANGQKTYINVLNSITTVQSLERQIISARLVQAQARVSLYRALGGQGWNNIVPSVTTLVSYPGKENPQMPAPEGEKMEKKQL